MSDFGKLNFESELNNSAEDLDLVLSSACRKFAKILSNMAGKRKQDSGSSKRKKKRKEEIFMNSITGSIERDLEVMIEKLIKSVLEKLREPFLEPLIRRAVKKQIQLSHEMIMTNMNMDSREMASSSQLRLELRFANDVQGIVLSGKHISGKDGTNLKLELVDADTKLLVTLGPGASARVKIVLLRVDPESNTPNKNKWSSEQFNQMIVKESLLIGDTYLKLNEGTGLVGNLYFPHREKWNRKCQYMLGAKIEDFDGINVIEAISSVFTLRDRRKTYNEKKFPPALGDKVSHLINIGKKGKECLIDRKIKTVEDFLRENFKNPGSLREILHNMSEGNLNASVAHALTCKELEDRYLYYIPGSEQKVGIVLNSVGQLFGLTANCHSIPEARMSEADKVTAQEWVASALEHWGDVVCYNEHSFRNDSSNLVSCDHTHPSGYLLDIIRSHCPVGTSHETAGSDYKQLPSIFSPPNTIMPAVQIGASPLNGGYVTHDHTQASTFSENGIFSNAEGTSHINGGYDTQTSTSLFPPNCSTETSHNTQGYAEMQLMADPLDITSSHNTFGYPFGITIDGGDSSPLYISNMNGSLDSISNIWKFDHLE